MSNSKQADPTEYLQDQFGAAYDDIEAAYKKITREVRLRQWVGYGLKGMAVLSGILLIAGVSPPLSRVLGVIIAIVVAGDALFSNHLRLVTSLKAAQAYRRLLRQVARTHQRDLAPILGLKERDPKKAKEALDQLNARLLGEIHAQAEEIEEALDETDLKALQQLSLDPERQGRSQV